MCLEKQFDKCVTQTNPVSLIKQEYLDTMSF